MRRISAIFIAACVVLIAASVGAVLYLGFNVDAITSAIVALSALTGMALFNSVSNRLRDRTDIGDQIADLSRGTADLARQVAEISRRLNAAEVKIASPVYRARGATDPLATEIGELGGLVRQIAETVASHAALLQKQGALSARGATASAKPEVVHPAVSALAASENDVVAGIERFRGLSRESIADLISKSVEANRIDLYLQPIVTLPQRKVRYYEAMSRLRTDDGDVIPAGDFIDVAESSGPDAGDRQSAGVPLRAGDAAAADEEPRGRPVLQSLRVDARPMRRCSGSSSISSRPIARSRRRWCSSSRRKPYRAFGPIEQESLAALAERGFRFSMDHVADLRIEPRELADALFPLHQSAGRAAAQHASPPRIATSTRRISPICWRAPAST